MQIVVNHVTRMKTEERIWVAGIDVATFENVRPVTPKTDLITRQMLRENGGPFGPGAVVDLGEVESCPSPPETEDHRFETPAARHLEDLTDDEYLALLEEVRDEDLPTAFGPALIEVRPGKLAVKAGEGTCSLAVVQVADPILHIKFGNLYMKFDTPETQAEVRVTDVRFYGLGRERWVVERGSAHLHNFRRLRIRYERDPDMHTAFLTLACSILCWRHPNTF